MNNKENIIHLLQRYGADFNLKDNNNNTAFDLANQCSDRWVIVDDIINTGLKIPFCYIGQEYWENTPLNYPKLNTFYKNCSNDTYILKGFNFGPDLIIVNGLITFIMLLLVSKK